MKLKTIMFWAAVFVLPGGITLLALKVVRSNKVKALIVKLKERK